MILLNERAYFAMTDFNFLMKTHFEAQLHDHSVTFLYVLGSVGLFRERHNILSDVFLRNKSFNCLTCRLKITSCIFASRPSQSVGHSIISITYQVEVTKR